MLQPAADLSGAPPLTYLRSLALSFSPSSHYLRLDDLRPTEVMPDDIPRLPPLPSLEALLLNLTGGLPGDIGELKLPASVFQALQTQVDFSRLRQLALRGMGTQLDDISLHSMPKLEALYITSDTPVILLQNIVASFSPGRTGVLPSKLRVLHIGTKFLGHRKPDKEMLALMKTVTTKISTLEEISWHDWTYGVCRWTEPSGTTHVEIKRRWKYSEHQWRGIDQRLYYGPG